MKGLLLKDYYMIRKYCRTYLLFSLVFIALSVVDSDSKIYLFYPCLFAGMIPVTLLGYDERSHWLQYSLTLPYSKTQIVSAKYIIGILAQLTFLILTAAVQAVTMVMRREFVLNEFLTVMLLVLSVSGITSSLSLPFMFKLGVEKGRVAYYFTVILFTAVALIAANYLQQSSGIAVSTNMLLLMVSLVSIGFDALSWYLSVVFYRKRAF